MVVKTITIDEFSLREEHQRKGRLMFWFAVKFMLMVLASFWVLNRCFDLLSSPSDWAVTGGVCGIIFLAFIWYRYTRYMVRWIKNAQKENKVI